MTTIPLPLHLVCLIRLQPNKTALSEFAIMDDMVQLCEKRVKSLNEAKYCRWQAFRVSELLTSGKHALYEIVDIAKDNPETLWPTL